MNCSGNHRKLATTVALGLLLALVASCGGGAEVPKVDSGATMPAKPAPARIMVYDGAYTSMPAYIAKDQGFYEKYNLDAELVKVASGPAGVAAMLGGSIDFAEPPTDQVIQNQLKGVDLKIVVGNETKNFYALAVKSNVTVPDGSGGFKDIMRALKGKRIGVNALGSTTHLMTNALLKESGMSPDDVTYRAIGSANTALAAWEAGQVDAVMGFTPFIEIIQAQESGRVVIDLSNGQGPEVLQQLGGAFEGFSAKGDFIDQRPDIVRAFIQAQTDAIKWMKDPKNHDALVQSVKKHVNVSVIPSEKLDQTVDLMIKNYNRYLGSTVDRESIKAWSKYMLEFDQIPKKVDPSKVVYSEAPQP